MCRTRGAFPLDRNFCFFRLSKPTGLREIRDIKNVFGFFLFIYIFYFFNRQELSMNPRLRAVLRF